MAARHPAPVDCPAPDDIVLFFPVVALQQPTPHVTFSTGGVCCCQLTVDPQSGEVWIEGSGESVTLAIGRTGADRPLLVRLSWTGATPRCRIGMQSPVAIPAFADAFAADDVTLARGVAMDRITPMSDEVSILPRGFSSEDVRIAGAIDLVSPAGGVGGWIVDLDRPGISQPVQLRCGDVILAQTCADRPRAAGAAFVDRAPVGRFVFAWRDVDRDALARCPPTVPVTVTCGDTSTHLEHVHRPISASTAMDFAARATGGANARISVVVPNWNYARYLPQRLGSLFDQTEPAAAEIILLDDASTDDSLAVTLEVAAAAKREVQIVTCPSNSGGVMPQWRRAAALARHEFTMIAEADDVAHPTLFAQLSAMLARRPDMLFAFCDSRQIDSDGTVLREDHKRYYAALRDRGLTREQVMEGPAFLRRFLLPRNLVINASAVMWRTAALRDAIARVGPALDGFRGAGDWRVYIEACRTGGSVGYIPAVLNDFRRHESSRLGRFTKQDHFAEVERIHALLLDICGAEAEVTAALATHRAALRRLWSLPAVDDDAAET